ncbi:hypothetical protein Syncc8109_1729 [Synechococcus sp. WH 8109]|nr:hypothetical protein Syncc8109_1729 [Synechococcus sp. WH 8109]
MMSPLSDGGNKKGSTHLRHHCHALGDEIQRVPSPVSPSIFIAQAALWFFPWAKDGNWVNKYREQQ